MFNLLGRPKGVAAFAAASAIAIVASISSAQAQEQQRSFNIPAQPLSSALLEFSRQSNIAVGVDPVLVNGRRAPAVQGDFTPSEALNRLLAGSGLSAQQRPGGGFVLADTSSPTRLGAADQATPSEENEQIVVTGTRLRTSAAIVPITEVTPEQIIRGGYGTADDYLRTIPSNFGSATPGFTGQNANGSEAATGNFGGAGGVDLRGLGAGSTLTLLNGRRVAALRSFVDLSTIPVAAISRIDILTDGASAIYGSDAVAGVVNIVTRNDFDGLEIFGRTELETETGNAGYSLSILGGQSWSSGNFNIGGTWQEPIGLTAADRDYATAADQRQTLTPEAESHSLYANITQQLGNDHVVTSTLTYSERDTSTFSSFYNQTTSSHDEHFYSSTALTSSFGDATTSEFSFTYSKDDVDFVAAGNPSALTFELQDVAWVLNSRLGTLPAGDVNFAVGLEYQNQQRVTVRSDQSRTVQSAFGELNLPLLGSSGEGLAGRLSLNTSVRYDAYEGYGDTTNPKVGVEWFATDQFRFFGSWGTSFRAPDLDTSVADSSRFALMWDFPDPSSPTGTTLAIYRAGGNSDLEPETAETFILGTEFQTDRFSLRASWFDVAYENRISELINASGIGFLGDPRFSAFVVRNPTVDEISDFLAPDVLFFNLTSASPTDALAIADLGYTNAGATNISGFDLAATARLDAWGGELNLQAQGTYFVEYEEQIAPGDQFSSLLDRKFFPTRWRALALADWTRDAWSLHGQLNYTGDYLNTVDFACAITACAVDNWITLDLGVSFSTAHNDERGAGVVIDFAVRNILNTEPPHVSDDVGIGYDPSHADPLGRVVSLSLRRRW